MTVVIIAAQVPPLTQQALLNAIAVVPQVTRTSARTGLSHRRLQLTGRTTFQCVPILAYIYICIWPLLVFSTLCYLGLPDLVIKKNRTPGLPGGPQLSIQLLISAQAMIYPFMRLSPVSRSARTACSLLGILSLCPSPPPHTHTLSSSLRINRQTNI